MATQVTVDISSADGSLRLKADAGNSAVRRFLKAFESFDTSVKGGSPQQAIAASLRAVYQAKSMSFDSNTAFEQSGVLSMALENHACAAPGEHWLWVWVPAFGCKRP